MTRRLTIRCPAKINTRLLVLGQRPDGYHDLDLDFTSIELSDRLELEESAGFQIEVVGASPDVVPVDENLVMRAARLLQRHVGEGRLPGARMRLTKRIPAAAGLGGGSSDAAGALQGLDRLGRLSVPPAEMADLALAIGSDVPFFLRGGCQRGSGRGELLTALPESPAADLILLHPPRGLSTGRVFAELRRQRGMASDPLTSRKISPTFASTPSAVAAWGAWNDLLAPAVALDPPLEGLLDTARRLCPEAVVGLTGSGPTIFVLLQSGSDVADVRDRLRRSLPNEVGLTTTKTLAATEYEATRFES